MVTEFLFPNPSLKVPQVKSLTSQQVCSVCTRQRFNLLFSCLDGWEGEQRFLVLAGIPAWHGPLVLEVCVGIRVSKCVCLTERYKYASACSVEVSHTHYWQMRLCRDSFSLARRDLKGLQLPQSLFFSAYFYHNHNKCPLICLSFFLNIKLSLDIHPYQNVFPYQLFRFSSSDLEPLPPLSSLRCQS